MSELLLSKKSLSVSTGLTVAFIERAMKVYNLPHYKVGGLVKFKISEIDVWLRQRKVS